MSSPEPFAEIAGVRATLDRRTHSAPETLETYTKVQYPFKSVKRNLRVFDWKNPQKSTCRNIEERSPISQVFYFLKVCFMTFTLIAPIRMCLLCAIYLLCSGLARLMIRGKSDEQLMVGFGEAYTSFHPHRGISLGARPKS